VIKKKSIKLLCLSLIFNSSLYAENVNNPSISALVFFAYSDNEEMKSFAVERAYLTFSEDISDKLSVKIQTDVDSKSSPQNIYLKNAKADLKISNGKFVIGLQGMNMFKVQELNWGKRYLDKTVMDRFKYSSSADMGIGYYYSKEKVHSSFLITNGTGYKEPENDSNKKLSFQLIYGNKNISKSDGYNIGLVYSHEPYERLGEVGIPEELFGDHTKQVFGLFGAYAKNNINLGAEWNHLNDSGLLDGNYNNTLYSLYFNYMLSSKYMLILKHDKVLGNIDNDYSLIAFEFKTKDNFLLAPNYRIGNNENILGINFKYSF
tara:strand:+ start:1981 stop:2937 length:957 start_codon:yes stop_codon:yes gene_type:complete